MGLDISAISDIQAEAGIIATIIRHPEFVLNISYMKPGYFFSVENGCMYWCVQQLVEEGVTKIDALNLQTALNSNLAVKKKVEEFNLTNIEEFVELSQYAARDTLEEYKMLVNNVITMAFKRELNKSAIEIQRCCFNEDFSVDQLNTLANDKLSDLASKFIIGTESVRFGEKIRDVWQRICENRNPNGTVGFPSKIPEFSKYFTFCKKELVLLSARMKKGKSSYFMNEIIHLSVNNNVPALMIDTEMSDEQFTKRAIANLSGVDVRRVENGSYSNEEAAKIEAAIEKLERAPFVHEYMPDGYNQAKIEALCQQWKHKMNIEFVVYDYMKCDDDASAFEVSNKLGSMCDFLKNRIAGKLDVAVLAGAQLNRQNDVGSSDKIEMYCSTSIRWFEKDADMLAKDGLDCGNYGASIVLNRNGAQTGDDYIDILFNGDKMQITQAKQHSTEEPMPF